MQTINAARSVNAQHDIGSLEVGKRADVVIRDASDSGALGFDPVYELMLLKYTLVLLQCSFLQQVKSHSYQVFQEPYLAPPM